MPEEIKVVLEADASQLTSEFKKAQAVAAEFSKRTLPLVSAGLNQAFQQSQRVAAGMKAMNGGLRNTGQGFLQLAQFADDAQYGMRGVLNNIPGLVMGFGAGAGVAGAVSLATLALAKLGPILKEIYTDTDAPKINAIADAVAARYRAEIEGLQKVARAKEIGEKVAIMTRDLATYASAELRIQDQRLTVIESQRRELELQRRLADELAGATGGRSDAGANRLKRMEEDLALARKESSLANAEFDRIANADGNLAGNSRARLEAANAEIARLQRNVFSAESQVQGAEDGQKAGLAGSGANLFHAKARLEKERELLEFQVKLREELTAEMERNAGAAKGMLKTLSDQIFAADTLKRQYEATLPTIRAIAEAQRQANEKTAKDTMDANRKDLVETVVGGAVGLNEAAKTEAEKAAAVAAARKAFLEENAVIRLRANGQKETADALERDIELREQAVGLAKQLGVTEAQALELLRKRQKLISIGQQMGQAAETSKTFRSKIAVAGSGSSKIAVAGGPGSAINNAGGVMPASLMGGVGRAGRPGVGIPASLRGGVAAAGSPNLGGRRGLGASAEERERLRKKPSTNPDSQAIKILQSIAESTATTSKALQALGIL